MDNHVFSGGCGGRRGRDGGAHHRDDVEARKGQLLVNCSWRLRTQQTCVMRSENRRGLLARGARAGMSAVAAANAAPRGRERRPSIWDQRKGQLLITHALLVSLLLLLLLLYAVPNIGGRFSESIERGFVVVQPRPPWLAPSPSGSNRCASWQVQRMLEGNLKIAPLAAWSIPESPA